MNDRCIIQAGVFDGCYCRAGCATSILGVVLGAVGISERDRLSRLRPDPGTGLGRANRYQAKSAQQTCLFCCRCLL